MKLPICSTSGSVYEHPLITWGEDGEGIAEVDSLDDLFSIVELGRFFDVPSLVIRRYPIAGIELEIYDTYRE